MAELMTCAVCFGQHPAGVNWCPVMQAPIVDSTDASDSTAISEANNTAQVAAPICSGTSDELEATRPSTASACVQCGGMRSSTDTSPTCFQCGAPWASAPDHRGAVNAWIVLPSGAQVSVERGVDIVIGRESPTRVIREALLPFDDVSRAHCRVAFSEQGGGATVFDLDSSNGTFIGVSATRLAPHHPHEVTLPTAIRLGNHVTVTLSADSQERT